MGQLFMHRRRLHRHTGVRTYVLLQRLGIPYEVERTVCSECRRVLDERRLKRAAAYPLGSACATCGEHLARTAVDPQRRAASSYGVGPRLTIASSPPAASVSSGRPATG